MHRLLKKEVGSNGNYEREHPNNYFGHRVHAANSPFESRAQRKETAGFCYLDSVLD